MKKSKILKKKVNTDHKRYYLFHCYMINNIMNNIMSDKEVEVIATFMSLDDSIVYDDRFNTTARKRARDILNISAGGLSNHITSLLKKEILEKNEVTKRIKIKDFIKVQDHNKQGYQILLNKKENE